MASAPVHGKALANRLFSLMQSSCSFSFFSFFFLYNPDPEKSPLSVGVTIASLCASSQPFNLGYISDGKCSSVSCMCLVSLYLNFACFYSADECSRKIWVHCTWVWFNKMYIILYLIIICIYAIYSFSLVKHILLFFSEVVYASSDIGSVTTGMEFNEIFKYHTDSFMWYVASYEKVLECVMIT